MSAAVCDICGALVDHTWECAAEGCGNEVCGAVACCDDSGSDSEGTEVICTPCVKADNECEACGRTLAAKSEDRHCAACDPERRREEAYDLWYHHKESGGA